MKPEKQIDCTWFEERIETFVDRELPTQEKVRFETHRMECSHCRFDLDLAEKVKQTFSSEVLVQCPDSVVEKILGVVSQTTGGVAASRRIVDRGFWGSWRGWIAVAVPMLLLVGVLGWKVFLEESAIPIQVVRPEYTQAEIQTAEKQVRVTLAFIGKVGLKSLAIAGKEVIEEGILVPAEKTMVAVMDTKALSFAHEKSREETP